jgi:hypothetical protein
MGRCCATAALNRHTAGSAKDCRESLRTCLLNDTGEALHAPRKRSRKLSSVLQVMNT